MDKINTFNNNYGLFHSLSQRHSHITVSIFAGEELHQAQVGRHGRLGQAEHTPIKPGLVPSSPDPGSGSEDGSDEQQSPVPGRRVGGLVLD